MGIEASLARLPGTFKLMPQELAGLPMEECQRRLAAEGQSAAGLGEEEARAALEMALGRRYCPRFAVAVFVALIIWTCCVAVLPEGIAVCTLALPAPLVLMIGLAALGVARAAHRVAAAKRIVADAAEAGVAAVEVEVEIVAPAAATAAAVVEAIHG